MIHVRFTFYELFDCSVVDKILKIIDYVCLFYLHFHFVYYLYYHLLFRIYVDFVLSVIMKCLPKSIQRPNREVIRETLNLM